LYIQTLHNSIIIYNPFQNLCVKSEDLKAMDKSELITELEISRQQMDTLKVELLARTRENRVLKNRLQELVDYGEGLDVKMPGQWSLEEQTTALRFMLKVAREKARGEGNANTSFDGKDLPSLAKLAFSENEEQWREVRRLERKVTELTKYVETLREKKEDNVNGVSTIKETTDFDFTNQYPDSVAVKLSSGEMFVRMSDLDQAGEPKSEVLDNSEKQIVTSSKAKLLKKSRLGLESKSEITLEKSENLLGQLTDQEFCDLQIRLLEAGHELSDQEQLVVEEVTAKLSENDKPENMLSNKEEEQQHPCQVILTGLNLSSTPGAVVGHARKYEGVTKIRVEGDFAVIQFRNIDVASKFRDAFKSMDFGGNHVVGGFSLTAGDVEILNDLSDGKDTHEADVEDECKSSVAVRVRRRCGK